LSGRCRACDDIMEEWEMKAIDPLTGTYTELCSVCITDDFPEDYSEISFDEDLSMGDIQ